MDRIVIPALIMRLVRLALNIRASDRINAITASPISTTVRHVSVYRESVPASFKIIPVAEGMLCLEKRTDGRTGHEGETKFLDVVNQFIPQCKDKAHKETRVKLGCSLFESRVIVITTKR